MFLKNYVQVYVCFAIFVLYGVLKNEWMNKPRGKALGNKLVQLEKRSCFKKWWREEKQGFEHKNKQRDQLLKVPKDMLQIWECWSFN